MGKLLGIVLVLSIAGCVSEKWDKDTLTNDCLRKLNENNEKNKIYTTMQVAYLCDCMTDKLLVKYKSASQSNKDEEGLRQINKACVLEVMTK